ALPALSQSPPDRQFWIAQPGDRTMLRLPTHGRYRYSAIENRPNYDWPDGKRLAFYIGLNVEHFAFMSGLGSDPFQRSNAPRHNAISLGATMDFGSASGAYSRCLTT